MSQNSQIQVPAQIQVQCDISAQLPQDPVELLNKNSSLTQQINSSQMGDVGGTQNIPQSQDNNNIKQQSQLPSQNNVVSEISSIVLKQEITPLQPVNQLAQLNFTLPDMKVEFKDINQSNKDLIHNDVLNTTSDDKQSSALLNQDKPSSIQSTQQHQDNTSYNEMSENNHEENKQKSKSKSRSRSRSKSKSKQNQKSHSKSLSKENQLTNSNNGIASNSNQSKQQMADNQEVSNNIQSVLNLLKFPTKEIEAASMQKELSSITILVRELWIGGFNDKCSEQSIQNVFRQYGEIESHEIHQNYAFIKFFKVEQASKAFQNHKMITMQLNSPEAKIYFSDHLRRFDIVGDSQKYISVDEITSVIYVGYQVNGEKLLESTVKSACEKYQKVKTIIKVNCKSQSIKEYYLVQFESAEQAKKVYDRLQESRFKIFHQKIDISIVLNADKCFQKNKDLYQQVNQQRHNFPKFTQTQSQQTQQIVQHQPQLQFNPNVNLNFQSSNTQSQQLQLPQSNAMLPQGVGNQNIPVQNKSNFVVYPQNSSYIQVQHPTLQVQGQFYQSQAHPLSQNQQVVSPQVYQNNRNQSQLYQTIPQLHHQHQQQQQQQQQQPQQQQHQQFSQQQQQQQFNQQQQQFSQQQQQFNQQQQSQNFSNITNVQFNQYNPNQLQSFQMLKQQQQQQQSQPQQLPTQLLQNNFTPNNYTVQNNFQNPVNISSNNSRQFQSNSQFGNSFINTPNNNIYNTNTNLNTNTFTFNPLSNGSATNNTAVINTNNISYANNNLNNSNCISNTLGVSSSSNIKSEQPSANNEKPIDLSLLEFISNILNETESKKDTNDSNKQNPDSNTQEAQQKGDKDQQNQKRNNNEEDEDEGDVFWSGFITRQGKLKTQVDMKIIKQNQEIQIQEFHLNINQRCNIETVLEKQQVGLVIITPSSSQYHKLFEDYISYFDDKQKAGVIQTSKNYIFIMSKSEQADKIYKLKKMQLLGIITNLQEEQEYDLNAVKINHNNNYTKV